MNSEPGGSKKQRSFNLRQNTGDPLGPASSGTRLQLDQLRSEHGFGNVVHRRLRRSHALSKNRRASGAHPQRLDFDRHRSGTYRLYTNIILPLIRRHTATYAAAMPSIDAYVLMNCDRSDVVTQNTPLKRRVQDRLCRAFMCYTFCMETSTKTSKAREVTRVDLGLLKRQVDRAAIDAGQTTSGWLRALIRRELSGAEGHSAELPGGASGLPSRPNPQAVYRAWLEPALVAKLDRWCEGGGFRSRISALRALLDGVNVGAAESPGRPTTLADAVDALGASNHQLVDIARSLRRIADALATTPGKTTVADRLALEKADADIRQHLKRSAQLVGELRPLLPTKRDKT